MSENEATSQNEALNKFLKLIGEAMKEGKEEEKDRQFQ